MKDRRHHNTDGRRQIKRGKTRKFIAALARKLGIPLKRDASVTSTSLKP